MEALSSPLNLKSVISESIKPRLYSDYRIASVTSVICKLFPTSCYYFKSKNGDVIYFIFSGRCFYIKDDMTTMMEIVKNTKYKVK